MSYHAGYSTHPVSGNVASTITISPTPPPSSPCRPDPYKNGGDHQTATQTEEHTHIGPRAWIGSEGPRRILPEELQSNEQYPSHCEVAADAQMRPPANSSSSGEQHRPGTKQEEETRCGEVSDPSGEERRPVSSVVRIWARPHLRIEFAPGDEPICMIEGHDHDDQSTPAVERVDAPRLQPGIHGCVHFCAHDLTIRAEPSSCLDGVRL